MKVHRSTLIAFLCLSAFLFQTDKFMAFAATASPDACLYALDSSAANALNISGAVNINAPSCGVVVDSSSSKAFTFSGAAPVQRNISMWWEGIPFRAQ